MICAAIGVSWPTTMVFSSFHFSYELLLAVSLVSAALADLREAAAWKDSIAVWTLQTRTLAYWMPKGVVLIGLVQEGCLNILRIY